MADKPELSPLERIEFQIEDSPHHPLTAIVSHPIADGEADYAVVFCERNDWRETPRFDLVKWTASHWQSIKPSSTTRSPADQPRNRHLVEVLHSVLGHPPKRTAQPRRARGSRGTSPRTSRRRSRR